jgi:hypothetical protein
VPAAIAAQAFSVTHAMGAQVTAMTLPLPWEHNHLFFLNNHTVNRVESNAIAIANS